MKQETAKLIYASPAKNSDILWATRFDAPDEFVFVEWQGRKYIAVNQLEYERARKEARVDDVLLDNDLWKKHETRTASKVIRRLLSELGIKRVSVPADFPAKLYKSLKDSKFKVRFADEPFFPERAVKTPEEIEDIMFAQKAMEAAFEVIKKTLADARIENGKVALGDEIVTSEMLRDIFELEVVKRGCTCESTIIASGEQAANPHCLGYGPIVPNTLIVCDMFPRSKKKHYWSDMTRMLVKGRASEDMKKMFNIVLAAQHGAEILVRPGVDANTIHQHVVQLFEKHGWKTGKVNGKMQGFIHGTGHGVGLDIHESPRVSLKKNQILQAGNVITIEPGLYYPGLGGCRIEDTVLVVSEEESILEFKNLAKDVPKELVEIP